MKELEIPKIDPGTEIVKPYQKEVKEQVYKQKPGHRVWELDLVDKTINEAKIEEVQGEYAGGVRLKVIKKPNCLYCSALNAKNADKQFLRMIAAGITMSSETSAQLKAFHANTAR